MRVSGSFNFKRIKCINQKNYLKNDLEGPRIRYTLAPTSTHS